MTPEKAQRHMAKWGAVLTGGDKLISSTLADFLPLSDYRRPIRFSAVYFPAWIINAELEANVTYEKSQVDCSLSCSLPAHVASCFSIAKCCNCISEFVRFFSRQSPGAPAEDILVKLCPRHVFLDLFHHNTNKAAP